MSSAVVHVKNGAYTSWLLAIMIVSPSFVLFPGYPALRLEYLLISILVLVALIKGLASKKLAVSLDGMGLLFMLMVLSCLASITYSAVVLHNTVVVNDLFLIIQLGLYYTVFAIGKRVGIRRASVFGIFKCLAVVGIGVGVFSILQYFNVFDINKRLLVPLYYNNVNWMSTKATLLVQGVHWRRIVGTFGNPNYCGMFFAILWAAVTAYYLFPIRKRMRYHVLVTAGIAIIALIMLTGSRTAFLSFAAITAVSLLLGKLTIRKLKFSLGIVLGVVIAFSIFVSTYSLDRMLKLSNDASLQGHVESFRVALEQIERSPVLGLGPQKGQLRSVVDNEYLLYARRYGLIGLLLLLLFHWYPLAKGYRRFSSSKNAIDRNLGLLGMQVAMIWAIYGLTSDVFKNPQMMGIVFFFFGLLWAKRPEQGVRLPN